MSDRLQVEPRIIVISGVSGAGKSTLASRLQELLEKRDYKVKILDGDGLRAFFGEALLYSSDDRLMVSKVLVYAASLLIEQGAIVILSTMLSQKGAREFLDKNSNYVEIFLDAPMEQVVERDAKGVYAENMLRDDPNIVGCDQEFNRPESADLVIKTHVESPEESLGKIVEFMAHRQWLRFEP